VSGEITGVLVWSLKNYKIFMGIPYHNHHQVIIDCGKATIMFPKTGCVAMSERHSGVILSSSSTWKYVKPLWGVSGGIPNSETNCLTTLTRGEPHHHPAED
jgi:hypothetical protein